jgi:hypothetical protein
MQRVDVFQQVNRDDAVIVDAQGLANGILRFSRVRHHSRGKEPLVYYVAWV